MDNFTPVEERFWKRVKKVGSCWEWQGTLATAGYGQIRAGEKIGGNRRKILAHRFSYELLCGPIPDELCVLHRCDNRACVNPVHLFLGTILDNALDMVAKGRHAPAKGELNPRAKLSKSDVLAIRELRKTGMGLKEIGQKFGVTKSLVWQILDGRIWQCLGS